MTPAPPIAFAQSVLDLRGPQFLAFYALALLVAVLALLIIRWRIASRGAGPLPPLPEEINARELAWLRGDARELVRLTGLELILRGYAVYRAKCLACAQNQPPRRFLAKPAQQMLDILKDSPKARELTERTTQAFASEAHDYEARAKAEGFLHPQSARQELRRTALFLVVIMAALALVKIVVALGRGHSNIGFLVFLAVAAGFVLMGFARLPRITPRGQAYLKQAQAALGDLRYRAAKLAEERDPLLILAAGVFGLSVLQATAFATYIDYYQPLPPVTGGSDGGGGSSCSSSSCSSGCGGGCGGGGCGGCGS